LGRRLFPRISRAGVFGDETSYGAFNVCTSNQEIFKDIFGPDFRSRMVGQVLEVEGEYQRNYCKGWKGSIRVTLARQVHLVRAAK
jgi:hypothetical protein